MRIFIAIGVLFFSLGTLAKGRDIFNNDHETRRPAQNDEFNMALDLDGCSGYLLGPTIGATAAHCRFAVSTVKSGVASRDGLPADGLIGKSLESDVSADYWIFEIEWNAGHLPFGMQVVPRIQTAVDELAIGSNETADKIYTVGLPVDYGNEILYYAYGYGKSDGADGKIKNNIGLINGNSGGAILREMDDMLVSSVSGGPHAWNQPGWNHNDWNDSSHWNFGPAMWKVYQKSKVLKSIFPGGYNKYLSAYEEVIPVSPIHSFLKHF